jgi:hypothetical protein
LMMVATCMIVTMHLVLSMLVAVRMLVGSRCQCLRLLRTRCTSGHRNVDALSGTAPIEVNGVED